MPKFVDIFPCLLTQTTLKPLRAYLEPHLTCKVQGICNPAVSIWSRLHLAVFGFGDMDTHTYYQVSNISALVCFSRSSVPAFLCAGRYEQKAGGYRAGKEVKTPTRN